MSLGIDDYILLSKAGQTTIESGKAMTRFYRWVKNLRVSKKEKEILVAAREHGAVQLIREDGGLFVVANSNGYEDDASRQDYLDAFESLCRRQWVRAVDEDGLFELNRTGKAKAEKYASKRK